MLVAGGARDGIVVNCASLKGLELPGRRGRGAQSFHKNRKCIRVRGGPIHIAKVEKEAGIGAHTRNLIGGRGKRDRRIKWEGAAARGCEKHLNINRTTAAIALGALNAEGERGREEGEGFCAICAQIVSF